jgi:tRNA-specific 2-thiouridylase
MFEKPEVRKLAAKYGLPTERKKDSQGLCFIGKLDLKDFLRNFLPDQPGAVLDSTGRIIGRHGGAGFFTLGERHGFELFGQQPDQEPLYVTGKDIERNTITVGSAREAAAAQTSSIIIDQVNFSTEPEPGRPYLARVRYRQPLSPCRLQKNGSGYQVIFDQPQTAAAGQSLVIYDGEICLGGGVIR